MQSIKGLKDLEEDQTGQAGEESVDMKKAAPLFKELAAFLENDDLDAKDALDSLKQELAGSSAVLDLKPVERSLGNYDFETALQKLRELAGELGIELD